MDKVESGTKAESPPAPLELQTPPAEKPERPEKPVEMPSKEKVVPRAQEEEELSSPPETVQSPAQDEQASDEIVVGAGRESGSEKGSPLNVTSDHEDEANRNEMEVDGEPVAGEDRGYVPQSSSYPKRKRTSTFTDLNEDDMDESVVSNDTDTPQPKPVRRPGSGFNQVTLGYWRDSPVPDEAGKHAVVGFIDVRDRLRTRIQNTTRAGNPVDNNRYPVPPGPGGSWVTFERVVFEPLLVGLNHMHVKEFVKQRAGVEDDSEEAKQEADKVAVVDAKRHVLANPPSETSPAPAIAYGPVMPEEAMYANRSDMAKRRKAGSGVSTINSNSPTIAHQQHPPNSLVQHRSQIGGVSPRPPRRSPSEYPGHADRVSPVPVFDPLLGTRPTRIVVGYWKPSSAPDPRDRHAVLGILGQNDMFRVKVVRETRDGRYIDGNFPSGAGALWIQWLDMELEPQLKNLSRAEVKEYVRVRQYQIDRGETHSQKVANETHAVYIAQQRVAHGVKVMPPHINGSQQPHEEDIDDGSYHELLEPKPEMKPVYPGQDLRPHRRHELPTGRHPLPDLDGRHPSRSQGHMAGRRELDDHARREMGRLEHSEQRRAQYAAERNAAVAAAMMQGVPPGSATHSPRSAMATAHAGRAAGMGGNFHTREEVEKLNGIWKLQEQQRSRPANDDVKYAGGVKYERKTNGPWAGKLVSSGSLLNIDGEDYVEYRVLAKPTF